MDKARAEQFCRSYERAMVADDAVALAGHYGFPHTSFTLGWVNTFADRDQANAQVAGQIDRLRKCGAGTDIRLTELTVQPVSEGSALCHFTWEVDPADGTPGWSWVNVYGLRQTADAQYFEFNISDNEIGELIARYPAFMEG
ncbi:MAG TPA: hypothetical protein VHX38_37070 [Pseudonocardiaceae bacterium]|jgi:gentisate 1,2-dioxygenase|nr:hypothetical protein [Pseudonocardiaceae bacterium]